MTAASKILFPNLDLGEHVSGAGDMTVLAVVGCAHKSEVSVVKASLFKASSFNNGHCLGRLCGGPHMGNSRRIADSEEDVSFNISYSDVDAMSVFDDATSVGDDAISVNLCGPSHAGVLRAEIRDRVVEYITG